MDSDNAGETREPSLPLNKALGLSNIGDEMLKSIFYRDRKTTLERIVYGAHELLEAEACGIFLISEQSPSDLVLEADYSDKYKHLFETVRLPIESRPGGGLTGHVATLGEITNLHGPALWDCEFARRGQPAQHLISGRCYSFLSIPLKGRKGRLMGMLNAHNKKDAHVGVPQVGVHFDSNDEAMARILANKVVLILESHRIFTAFRDIMDAIYSTKKIEEILTTIVSKAVTLLSADRGDVAWWDETRQNLILLARQGESRLNIGQAIPAGFIQSIWGRKDTEIDILGDINSGRAYVEFHPETRSEIAAILGFRGHRLGVLNAESFRRDGFDEQDAEILRLLAEYASIAAQVVRREAHLRTVVQEAWEAPATLDDVLRRILGAVSGSFGFDAGLIYIADQVAQRLTLLATIGCGDSQGGLANFHHAFNDVSFAGKIFRARSSQYSHSPWEDPDVDKRGLHTFDIHSSLVGAPLIYRDETVGVLVCWTRTGRPVLREQKDFLEPFARLAAQLIALFQLEDRRSRDLAIFNHILRQMQSESTVAQNLSLVLESLQMTYFDRARYYEWDDETGGFVGLDCVGMNRAKFLGHRIDVRANPYARDIYDRALVSTEAHKYEPNSLGRDPESDSLEKDPDKPWATVPLVVNRKVYGYIAGDNVTTGRVISQDALSFMSQLGAVASQAIANAGNLEQFLLDAVHTLRSPSHSIQNLSEFLIAEGIDNPNGQSWLRTIHDEAQRLARLTKKVGRLSVSRTRVSLREIVRASVSAFQPIALRDSVDIMVVMPEGGTQVVIADRDAISKVFDSLLENALAFSSPGQEITVGLAIEPTWYRIVVLDEGPGVPEDLRRRIFKMGQSIPPAGHPRSLGVGLPIARQIVEAHGGTLDCIDPPTGRGACFCFKLPQCIGFSLEPEGR